MCKIRILYLNTKFFILLNLVFNKRDTTNNYVGTYGKRKKTDNFERNHSDRDFDNWTFDRCFEKLGGTSG